jgi:hypothetical protein
MSKKRWYLGCRYDFCLADYEYVAFQSEVVPTEKSHGEYLYCVGPFRTKRGVRWAEKFGKRNPHFTCVNDAERFAASEAAA